MPQQLGVFWPRQLTADRRDCIDSLRDDVMVFGRLVLEDKVSNQRTNEGRQSAGGK